MVQLNPYLGFRDTAREAMTFYASVLGGEPTFRTFGDGGMSTDPADADKILHSELRLPDGGVLMASDAPSSMTDLPSESSITVSLSGGPEDSERLHGVFARLAEGGTHVMPLDTAPWGDEFGMCTDRFGTGWMVSVAAAPAD
ncbi:VOC family protein [Cellulomonas sp. SLBN-39]|uniref:VOC family protein n=1 Tax=Cellulomonas sp. SLBN-39 TaxID=2768446 RepID=UPI00115011AB|nr:VOC family protein [Cellulomonas sp. SLBN-39]TQL02067.1 PhnB protein [Cellulomonas sp. SLBN-39]